MLQSRGNSGTYLDGSYDYACKNGRCTLRGPLSSPGFCGGEGVYHCSDLVHCSKDDSSEESTEDPIVDVGVSVVGPGNGKGRQPTRRPRNMEDDDHMNTRTNQSMLYAQGMRGSEGSGGSEGSCPGSLEECIGACPTKVARVYTLCVDNCGRVCSKK